MFWVRVVLAAGIAALQTSVCILGYALRSKSYKKLQLDFQSTDSKFSDRRTLFHQITLKLQYIGVYFSGPNKTLANFVDANELLKNKREDIDAFSELKHIGKHRKNATWGGAIA